jgi:SAM-dependent methyltransferase
MLAGFRQAVRLVQTAVRRVVLDPLRYRQGQGYDAQRFWGDRFRRHGLSLMGSGLERLSDHDNVAMYAEARARFKEFLREEHVPLAGARVLEIGCGPGFYTELCRELGVQSYVAVDITDALFAALRSRFPEWEFRHQDVTEDVIEGEFDVVLMIDVVQHIVEENRLAAALANVDRSLGSDGIFVMNVPDPASGPRRLCHVRLWTPQEVWQRLPGYDVSEPFAFRGGSLFALRRALDRART